MEVEGQIAPNLPINFSIYKNGDQNVSVTMLPLNGQEKLHPNAELKYNIRLYDVTNDEFNFVKDFDTIEFPKIDSNNSTTVMNKISKFYAEVPYKMTLWENGLKLEDIPDVENKLKQAYLNIGNLIDKGMFTEFESKIAVRENNMTVSMYLSPIEKKARINSLIEDVKNGFKMKSLPKDMVFKSYGYGKIGAYKRSNGEPVISLYNEAKKEELILELMFYMPNGKTEFEVI